MRADSLKGVSYLTPQQFQDWLARAQLTQQEFARLVGLSPTAVSYYLRGRSPVPYNLAKLMIFFERYGGMIPSALSPEKILTKEDAGALIAALGWDRNRLSRALGYVWPYTIDSWLHGNTRMKYIDARLIEYFMQYPETAGGQAPIDRILADRIASK